MFDIGWTEMLVVAIVAIIFVGPKDLPGMLRTFGKTARKIRGMAGDFQRQFDDALKDAELDGVKDSINSVRNLDPTKQIKDKLNPLKSDLDKVEKDLNQADEEEDLTTLFDESKGPSVSKPVKVDVDAALERQRKFDEAAKASQSSGTKAVPGLDTAPKKTTKKAARTGSKPSAKKKVAKAAVSAQKPPAKTATKPKPSAKRKTAKPKAATKPRAKRPAKKVDA